MTMRGASSATDVEFGIFILIWAPNECQLAFRALLTTAAPPVERASVGGALSRAIATAAGATVFGIAAKEATAGVALVMFGMNPGGGSTPSAISRAR